ncbi:MAG: hypothetical protein JWO67_5000 [Streptosporangiaceae bacterium]|nr:hypothetical protein [Streptosporangiaceae bacterium]
MSFRVTPGALDAFSQSLNTLSGDAKKAKTYIETHTKIVEGTRGHLLGFVYSLGVLRLADAVQKNVGQLDSLSSASGSELHNCANVYRHTERKNAEKIDQTYPK